MQEDQGRCVFRGGAVPGVFKPVLGGVEKSFGDLRHERREVLVKSRITFSVTIPEGMVKAAFSKVVVQLKGRK